jgi:DNA-binding winged helix-turn-helix (wHTH) protein/TolB-like protein/Tfp pilus assembly protein PilF
MSNAHTEIYEFDKFRLDVSERNLWRDGKRVPLSEKAFETLCALVRRGNHLVSKDELLNEVWADAIVEENNLDKNISILRQVLGERSGKGKFIETVRGHGFRFVAEVREIQDAETRRRRDTEISEESSASAGESNLSEPPAAAGGLTSPDLQISDDELQFENQSDDKFQTENQSEISNHKSQIQTSEATQNQKLKTKSQKSNRFQIAAIFGALIIGLGLLGFYVWQSGEKSAVADVPIKTIAVLPFKSLGAETRNEALELGMADTLIAKLGGEEIIVRPLGSISRYANLDQNSLNAGRELGVETVLDGTIQTADNRIRITAQLFRVSDGKQLWTGQFDEKFTDIFAVQNSISERVATALKIRLGNKGKKHQTENVEAYQLYMKGRYYLIKASKPDPEQSVSYYQQAIELDPNYTLAYAGLADAYRGQTVGGEMPSSEVMPKAKAAALKAIELDDTLAEAHANLGHIYFWYDWNWNAAEKQHQRALELDPNSADTHQFYAHLLSNTGRHTEALAEIKRARELDPLNLRINALEGLFLLHAGQTDAAIAKLQKTLELDPNYRLAVMFSARAYIEKGMFAEAIAATNKAREISAVSSEPIAYGTYALAKLGKITEARAALDELLKSSTTKYVPPHNIALIYNALGESSKALDYLEKAFAEKDVRMVWLKVEPKWNNLRNEPRFIELMRRMNFQ